MNWWRPPRKDRAIQYPASRSHRMLFSHRRERLVSFGPPEL